MTHTWMLAEVTGIDFWPESAHIYLLFRFVSFELFVQVVPLRLILALLVLFLFDGRSGAMSLSFRL